MLEYETLIMNYRPQYARHAPATWAIAAGFVRATVRAYAAGRNAEHVRVALIAMAGFAEWLVSAGLDNLDGRLLRVDLIDAYTAARMAENIKASTPARQRKVLLMLAGAPRSREQDRVARTVSTPLAPYTAAELAEIRDWANWQPNEISRLSAHGLVGLGLGCGLTRAELPAIRRGHVVRNKTAQHVRVTGRRARTVPVDPAWADLLDYAVTHTAGFLIGPTAMSRTPQRLDHWLDRARGIAPLPSRMRTTWLIARMDEGMSAGDLTTMAGLSTIRSLERLIRTHAPQHRALLHGTRRTR